MVRRGTDQLAEKGPGGERGFHDGRLRVLYASSFFIEDKGFFDALEAAALCERRGLPTHWKFVGAFVTRADEDRARASVSSLSSVEILGQLPRPELMAAYLQADAFVFTPSPQEGFGLVRVEAMAAGLPVITTEAGGASELLEDGCEGFIVDYGNPAAIVERLRRLAADRTLLARMSRAARRRQRTEYSLPVFERSLAEAWATALDGPGH